jgi:hypothetical protein
MSQKDSKKVDYSYAANANLVIQTKRRNLEKVEDPGIQSLWGKIDMKDMGTRAAIPADQKGKSTQKKRRIQLIQKSRNQTKLKVSKQKEGTNQNSNPHLKFMN